MKFIMDGWAKEGKIEEALVTPSKTLNNLVEQGSLGRKSGKGVFDYSK